MHLAYLKSSFLNCRPALSRSPSIYNQLPKADKSAVSAINRLLRVAGLFRLAGLVSVVRVMLLKVRSLQFDLDVHACGQIQTCQGFNRLVRRIDDIDQAFVGAYLKLLT